MDKHEQETLNLQNSVTEALPRFIASARDFRDAFVDKMHAAKIDPASNVDSSDGTFRVRDGNNSLSFYPDAHGEIRKIRAQQWEHIPDAPSYLDILKKDNTYTFDMTDGVLHLASSIMETPYVPGSDEAPDPVTSIDDPETLKGLEAMLSDVDGYVAFEMLMRERRAASQESARVAEAKHNAPLRKVARKVLALVSK